jgi:hypothetical protein
VKRYPWRGKKYRESKKYALEGEKAVDDERGEERGGAGVRYLEAGSSHLKSNVKAMRISTW